MLGGDVGRRPMGEANHEEKGFQGVTMLIDTRFRPARTATALSLTALAMLSACSGGSSGGGDVTMQPIPSPTPL